jgi:hypothetical protein
MGLLYEGTTATRDTVLGPGVALVSLDVTFHEDGVAGVGLGRTPTETPVWAYTIAHGVAVRAGQTRTFAAFGPARAASAFTRHVRVMGVDATVVCYVDATGTCAADAEARAAYERVETAIDVYGDAEHTERVYAVQSGARTYYAHVVDANDPNRGAVGAVGAVGAGEVQETVPRLEVRPSERGIQVLADEATFPDVPDESTLTIATGTARLTLAHGKPVHVKRETKDGLAVLVVYDERGPVNLGSIGDPRSIVVATTTEGAPTEESQVTVAREENTTWFGPAPRNATRLVAVPGVDIEVYEGRTIEEQPRPDRAVVAAYTGKSCRVYLFAESGAESGAGSGPAASTRVDVPLVARVRWHTGRSGFVEVVAQRRTEQSSAESFLEIEPGAADRTPLLYVEVFVEQDAGEIALVAPYVDRAAMRLAKRGSEYELVVPDAADRVACAVVAEREHDADVDVVWPWTTTQSPERLNAVAFAVFAGPATLTFSPDGGPFRATMRADATGTLRVRVSEADAELDAEIRDARVEVRAFIDGALFARTVTVASVADKPTELYVVGGTDQWAHEMRPDLEVAPDHTPLIWLIGARQVTSGPGDQVEVLDLVDSEDTRVVCGAEELTRDDKLPRFFKVVDVALAASTASAASAASTVSALAVTGVPRGAVVTVTNVRAVETRFNGSLDVTLG